MTVATNQRPHGMITKIHSSPARTYSSESREALRACSSSVSFSPSTRITSDVSYDAGVDGGVLAYWGAIPADAGFYIFGGTSAGSPQWAAVIAIADQLHHTSFGLVAPYLYALVGTNSFHDITVGSNSNEPGTGFLSTTGYDPPTGLGSPDVGVLVQQI